MEPTVISGKAGESKFTVIPPVKTLPESPISAQDAQTYKELAALALHLIDQLSESAGPGFNMQAEEMRLHIEMMQSEKNALLESEVFRKAKFQVAVADRRFKKAYGELFGIGSTGG